MEKNPSRAGEVVLQLMQGGKWDKLPLRGLKSHDKKLWNARSQKLKV